MNTTSDKIDEIVITTAELESWFTTLDEYTTSDLADLVVILADDETKRQFLLPLYKASKGEFDENI